MSEIKFFNLPETCNDLKNKNFNTYMEYCRQGYATNDDKWRDLVFLFLFKFYNNHVGVKKYFSDKSESYFVFECKRMDERPSTISKYVYRKPTSSAKEKEDKGGLYRFLINKYAANKNFGGMIGFVIKGENKKVIAKIKKRILELTITEQNINFGQLINKATLNKTIIDNENTFLSDHVRLDKDTNKIIHPILIYHIFFDMTDC